MAQLKLNALKFTENHGFHGISRKLKFAFISRKAGNFTENVAAVKSWI